MGKQGNRKQRLSSPLQDNSVHERYKREVECLRLHVEEVLTWEEVGERVGLTKWGASAAAMRALKRAPQPHADEKRKAWDQRKNIVYRKLLPRVQEHGDRKDMAELRQWMKLDAEVNGFMAPKKTNVDFGGQTTFTLEVGDKTPPKQVDQVEEEQGELEDIEIEDGELEGGGEE